MASSRFFCSVIVMTLLAGFSSAAFSQVVVDFPDPNLEEIIRSEIGKPTGPIYDTDLLPLRELWADAYDVVDLTGLEYCVNLDWLDLSDNLISDVGPLAGLKDLGYLDLSDNQISDLGPLAGLVNLYDLGLGGLNEISDLTPLSGLTNLRVLSMYANQITDTPGDPPILGPLATLEKLEELLLNNNEIREISPLCGLTNLTRLSLSSNPISNFSCLPELTNLTDLGLGNTQFTDLTLLTGLTNLESLYLANNQISDIDPLAGLTNLISLDLSWNQISDLTPVAGLVNLTRIELDTNQLIDTAGEPPVLEPLAGLNNLEDLHLDDNQISNICPLAGLDPWELDLQGNQINDLSCWAAMPPIFESMEILGLSGNQISDIEALLSTGLGEWSVVHLQSNPLSCTSVSEHIPALEARGVTVDWTDTEPCNSTTTTSTTTSTTTTAAPTTTTAAGTTTTGAATTTTAAPTTTTAAPTTTTAAGTTTTTGAATTTTATTTSISTTTLPQSDVAGGVPFCAIKLRDSVAVEKTKLVPKDKVQKAIDKGFEQGECNNPQNGQVLCKDKPARPGKPEKRANVLVPDSQVQKALDKGFYTLGECETM